MTRASIRLGRASALCAACAAAWLLGGGAAIAASTVYKWVDVSGVTHLSSDKPPAGVPYERVAFASTSKSSVNRASTKASTGSASPARVASVSAEQAARRDEVVTSLRDRECVMSLEALDRMGKAGTAVDATEFRRLQQTADQNCSTDPTVRGKQEEKAARLRVARSDVCVDARNQLADMLAPGRRPTRDQLKTQQEFIESHCTAPVR